MNLLILSLVVLNSNLILFLFWRIFLEFWSNDSFYKAATVDCTPEGKITASRIVIMHSAVFDRLKLRTETSQTWEGVQRFPLYVIVPTIL